MKIAFSGCGGNGKTTLLKELERLGITEQWGVTPLYSATRSSYNSIGVTAQKDKEHCTLAELRATQLALVQKQYELENSVESFITDRSISDYYLYTLMMCGTVLTRQQYADMQLDVYDNMQKYDMLIHFNSVFNDMQHTIIPSLFSALWYEVPIGAQARAQYKFQEFTLATKALELRVHEVQNMYDMVRLIALEGKV